MSATTGAVTTALGLKFLTKVNTPIPLVPSHPLFTSFIPFIHLPLDLQAPHISP